MNSSVLVPHRPKINTKCTSGNYRVLRRERLLLVQVPKVIHLEPYTCYEYLGDNGPISGINLCLDVKLSVNEENSTDVFQIAVSFELYFKPGAQDMTPCVKKIVSTLTSSTRENEIIDLIEIRHRVFNILHPKLRKKLTEFALVIPQEKQNFWLCKLIGEVFSDEVVSALYVEYQEKERIWKEWNELPPALRWL